MNDDVRALARRWFEEVWNDRRADTIFELASTLSVGHAEGRDVHGPEEWKAMYDEVLATVPDLRMTVEDVVCEGEQAVVRWHASGTHAGRGLGLEPTHQPISTRGMTWLRFREGRVVEGWDSWNATEESTVSDLFRLFLRGFGVHL